MTGEKRSPVSRTSRLCRAVSAVMQSAVDHFGRLDGVTCCAGIMVQKFLWEMDERDWDDVIAVHLKGHFSCAPGRGRGS